MGELRMEKRKRLIFSFLAHSLGPLEMINLQQSDTMSTSQSNLVFVGVMTAKEFLTDRAKAVYDTWGKEVPGRLAFFSSEGSYSDQMPVIALKGVDDRYPPQKKSCKLILALNKPRFFSSKCIMICFFFLFSISKSSNVVFHVRALYRSLWMVCTSRWRCLY